MKSAASAPPSPARQGDGDGGADGDAGIDRVGEMDRVAVGAALVDGGAGLGEREGLGVVVEDGGGDAGGGGSYYDPGAARVGGRRGQRHAVAFVALDLGVVEGRQGEAEAGAGVEA